MCNGSSLLLSIKYISYKALLNIYNLIIIILEGSNGTAMDVRMLGSRRFDFGGSLLHHQWHWRFGILDTLKF